MAQDDDNDDGFSCNFATKPTYIPTEYKSSGIESGSASIDLNFASGSIHFLRLNIFLSDFYLNNIASSSCDDDGQ